MAQRAPGYLQPKESTRFRPRIIRRLKGALRDVANGKRLLPALEALPVYTGELYVAKCKDGKDSKRRYRRADPRRRALREERREAIGVLLHGMADYVSAISRVVYHEADTGDINGVRLVTLAELSGLNARRADRVVRNVRDAGYVHSEERCEADADMPRGYRGFPAVRQFTMKLINDIGLSNEWHRAAKHHSRRAKARRDARRAAAGGELQSLSHRTRRRSGSSAHAEPRQVGAVLPDKYKPPT